MSSAAPESRRRWFRLLLAVLVLMGCGSYAVTTLRIATGLGQFVTSPEEATLGSIAARMAESEGARTEVLIVDAPDIEDALQGAATLAETLRGHREVAWVQTGVDPKIGEVFYELVYPHRFHLASDDPEHELPAQLGDAGLQAMARELKHRLTLPTSAWVKRIAPGDPWLFFEGRTRALERLRDGALQVHDGRFVTSDGRGAVVLLGTLHSPFDTAHQRELEEAVASAIAEVRTTWPDATVERSSIGRLAVQSETDIRADVQRITIASSVAVLVVFVVLYGSARVWLVAVLPLAVGLSVAAAVVAALFESVHGITLAFGATLIGVAIDYPVHFFTHHAMDRSGRTGPETMASILPGMRLGAATTAVAFSALAFVELPGVRELGVFAAVGIGTALVTTVWVLPVLPLRPRPTRVLARVNRGFAIVLRAAATRRWLLALPLGAAALVCVTGLPQTRWIDDVSALNRLEPTALAEDERVRARVSRHDLGRLVVSTGETVQEVLQRNDEVAAALRAAEADGRVRFTSLHDLLWSEALQRRNLEVFAQSPDLADRTAKALSNEGFVADAFAPMRATLRAPGEPLSLPDLLGSPLGRLAKPFVLRGDGPPAIVTFIRDLEHPDALAPYIDGMQGVYDFDREQFSSRIYRRYRERVTRVVAIGLVLVAGMLLVHHRKPARVAAALLPALVAVGSTVAILSLAGQQLHILHLMALLLVLGIGADYGIFLVERARGGEHLGPTLVSVFSAWVTTVCAFGLLATSSHPSLQALGTTVTIGVTACLLLAPAATLALRGDRS